MKGFNRFKKSNWFFSDLESARRPVLHCDEIPVPTFTHLPELESDQFEDWMKCLDSGTSNSSGSEFEGSSSIQTQFNQSELSDLVRDLGLSKELSEVLASRLNEKNCLSPRTKITFYRNRKQKLLQYFTKEKNLLHCNDIQGLLLEMGIPNYNPKDWRLFLDGSKVSLKCVLFLNGNKHASIPIGHSTTLKKQYKSIKIVLHKLAYEEHHWLICIDLKMVNFLLGQQAGYTKYPCFHCLWDSRARDEHWSRKDWPPRSTISIGTSNIINEPLVS